MGFYSPHSLVQDARRHGVEVRTPDINASAADATLEPCAGSEGGLAVRLGVGSVRGIGDDLAARIAAGRPYAGMEAVARHAELTLPQLEALATAGAFSCFPSPSSEMAYKSRGRVPVSYARTGKMGRREALWTAGAVAQSKPDRLAGIVTGADAPRLPGMDEREESIADLWATGVSPEGHPTRFVRAELDRLGVVTAVGLADVPDGSKVLVGGVVTHRQRPATASGTTFLNLEDETGLVNVICSKGCWTRHRRVARTSPALLVRGRLEKVEGVINVVAERFSPLPLSGTPSRARSGEPPPVGASAPPATSSPAGSGEPSPVGTDPVVGLRSRDFR
ncbi:MAG: dnaE2 [Acidimicrobiales bacterium]|nr:dnaE2 [Acidimicrobiales bacterium]